jgi:hypothetical protein
MTPPIVDEQAASKAVKSLVKALGIPEARLSRIEINAAGTVKVFTRERAYYTAAHVAPFKEDES